MKTIQNKSDLFLLPERKNFLDALAARRDCSRRTLLHRKPPIRKDEGSFVSFETVETLKRYFYMGSGIGPMPIQLVVVIAVRNAVSAATTTFTSVSMILFPFMVL